MKIQLNNEQNNYLKSISWLFADNIFRIIGAIFVGAWAARYLGAENYGKINYGLSIYGIFLIFVNIGMSKILTRELVKYPEKVNEFLGTATGLKIIGTLITVILINLYSHEFESDDLQQNLILIFSLSTIFNSQKVIDIYNKSIVKSEFTAISNSIGFFFSTSLKVVFILMEMNVVWFAIAIITEEFIKFIFMFSFYNKNGNSVLKWRFKWSLAYEILKDCWYIGVTLFIIGIHNKIDRIMIGNFLTKTEVGIYSISVFAAGPLRSFIGILQNTLLPYFVKTDLNNKKLFERRFKQLLTFGTWSAIFLSLLMIIFGKKIIILLFGVEFESAYSALIFSIWEIVFVIQLSLINNWLVNKNLQRFQLYTNMIGLIVNVSLNYVLIPIYGIQGAAFTTLLTRMTVVWISPLIFKEAREVTLIALYALNPINLVVYLKEMKSQI